VNSIYLDYNATAPLRPVVRVAMDSVRGLPLNPSSVHRMGQEAKKRLEAARKTIADAISVFPHEIIFTASGTEANNIALRGFAERTLLVAATEHASVAALGARLGAATLPVDENGRLRLDALAQALAQLNRPALVSVMLANNETGVIQPIAEIAAIAHAHGALLHCDAVQALGKIPLDAGLLGVDLLTLSAHKAGGPIGAGALVARGNAVPQPLLVGGGQESGRRAGTENLAAIAGFAALVSEVAHCPEAKEMQRLRDRLEARIAAMVPDAVIHAHQAPRLPNTSNIAMPGVNSETQLMHFDLAGFCVSAGSACSSGRIAPSHVLSAMGVAPELAQSSIRASLGWATTEVEIEAFAEAWIGLYQRLKMRDRASA
jgi:cysteine desulfurase